MTPLAFRQIQGTLLLPTGGFVTVALLVVACGGGTTAETMPAQQP